MMKILSTKFLEKIKQITESMKLFVQRTLGLHGLLPTKFNIIIPG